MKRINVVGENVTLHAFRYHRRRILVNHGVICLARRWHWIKIVTRGPQVPLGKIATPPSYALGGPEQSSCGSPPRCPSSLAGLLDSPSCTLFPGIVLNCHTCWGQLYESLPCARQNEWQGCKVSLTKINIKISRISRFRFFLSQYSVFSLNNAFPKTEISLCWCNMWRYCSVQVR